MARPRENREKKEPYHGDIHRISITGDVISEVRTRTTPAGKPACEFEVSTRVGYTDLEGVIKAAVTEFTVVTWGEKASALIAKGLKKGDVVAAFGCLALTDEGNHTHAAIGADEVMPLGSGAGRGELDLCQLFFTGKVRNAKLLEDAKHRPVYEGYVECATRARDRETGDWVKVKHYFKVKAWNKRALLYKDRLTGGTQCIVDARFELMSWEDEETKEQVTRKRISADQVKWVYRDSKEKAEGESDDGDESVTPAGSAAAGRKPPGRAASGRRRGKSSKRAGAADRPLPAMARAAQEAEQAAGQTPAAARPAPAAQAPAEPAERTPATPAASEDGTSADSEPRSSNGGLGSLSI